jgi:hypothetical protein
MAVQTRMRLLESAGMKDRNFDAADTNARPARLIFL